MVQVEIALFVGMILLTQHIGSQLQSLVTDVKEEKEERKIYGNYIRT